MIETSYCNTGPRLNWKSCLMTGGVTERGRYPPNHSKTQKLNFRQQLRDSRLARVSVMSVISAQRKAYLHSLAPNVPPSVLDAIAVVLKSVVADTMFGPTSGSQNAEACFS